MAWATPSFEEGATVQITAPALTGTIKAQAQADGVVSYLVYYLDTEGNPCRAWFKQGELAAGS